MSLPDKKLIEQVMERVEVSMRTSDGTIVRAPMSILPHKLTPTCYFTLPRVMPLFAKMTDRIARDYEYLVTQVGPTDPFSAKLAEIVKQVYMAKKESSSSSSSATAPAQPGYQSLMLGLLRSDYLYDSRPQSVSSSSSSSRHKGQTAAAGDDEKDDDGDDDVKKSFHALSVPFNTGWKQVEINTIASSFPALSSRCTRAVQELFPEKNIYPSSGERDMVNALERAHRYYVQSYYSPQEQQRATTAGGGGGAALAPVVVFVVQPGERNVGDQGLLKCGLEQLGVRVVRKSIVQLADELALDPHTRHARLKVTAEEVLTDEELAKCTSTSSSSSPTSFTVPVSLFYLRSLYDFKEYDLHPESWEVRLRMEQSMSIKCPSAPYHLCTWKTIQKQLYSDEALLKRFVPDPDERAVLRTFMVPHDLIGEYKTSSDILKLVRDAVANPKNYVVKTLREGYGFILEGDQMKEQLEKFLAFVDNPEKVLLPMEEREAMENFANTHLLVYRILSKGRTGSLIRNGEIAEYSDLEGEFGSYGAILSEDGGKIHFNVECGYLLRTKSKSTVGGGVMSGVSSLDSIEFV